MADEEDFVVERVLDKRVGRTGKVSYIYIFLYKLVTKTKSLIGPLTQSFV